MVEEAQEKVFNGHILPQLEFRVTRADGKHRTFRQSSKVVKTNGELLMTGVVQDITEQRQKDRQLKEANEKLAVQNEAFRHAEKVASIGMWTWNLDTGHTYYSDNIYLIYGLKPQSIAPGFENFGKYMHPDDRERMKQMPANIEAARTAIATSYRIIRTDGEMRYLRSRSQPITSPENHTIIIGSTQDVTDEVQLHQQLQEEIRFAEILSDTIVDRIIVTDNANNIISWNKSCETVYNIGKDDVIGRNFFDVFPELRIAEVKERFKKALNGEMIHIPIAPSIQTAGYHELFMVPFKDENGKISGILHVLHDVTHLLQLQEQLSARLLFIEKLLESSINRIIVLDNDLHFQLWNRQCETFFGRKKEDVLQKHVLEIFPKFMTDHLYPKCLKAFEGDTVYVPADETAFPPEYYETYFIPLRNDRNETTGVLWITHDLGERFLAQQKLKTSERHLKTAQEIALMGSYEFDISNKQLKLSEQVFRICDYPSDEPITIEKLYASVHSHDLQAVQQMLNGLQNDLHHPKDVYESHFRIIRANGQVRHLYTRGKYEGPEGSPEKFTGIVHDITEKKMAEEELAKQQELLRQAEEIAHIGSWELDPVADEMYWSDEIFRIYRYEPQSFVPVLEFYINTTHPEDKEQLKNAISQAVSHARLQALRYRIFTVDGNIRYIQTGIRPLCDASGRVIRLVATMQDITEQKKLEDELNKRTSAIRTQYQMDRHTEKIKNLASWQWNTQTGKITWGEHLYRLFGRAPHSFEPSVESFIEVIHPDDREKVKNYLNDIPGKNPGALPDQEFRVTVNEKIRYMRFSGRVITNTFVVGSVLDTTEDTLLRRQLAERISSIESLNRKLEEKNKKLEEINEELTSFAFVASHDLREPLRKIQIFSDWLCKKETAHLSPDGLDRFQRIQAAVHRMDVLIDDILSFSHVNTADKKLIDVPLNKILENVKSDLAETISHTKAVITSDSLPVIKGNASQLSQLFQNLIGNALKYQEPGSMPEINIRCEHISGKNINYHAASHELDYVKISFTDNGIGFDEQYSRKIFQMFQRLHGINEYPGTGMGLAICKKITEHHNGFILAQGTPGQGSTFECYFPMHIPSEEKG
jgi:PAS domain S-box-containing protein